MADQEGGEGSPPPERRPTSSPAGNTAAAAGIDEEDAELLSSLISLSYSARSFPSKWRSIRANLQHLSSAVASGAGGGASPSSIRGLLREIHDLAVRCAGGGFDGGKLRLMSDVDIVAAKLDHFVEHLAVADPVAGLKHSTAIVASKPGAGASRDDLRFYAKDLLLRLKVGDGEIRSMAIAALNEAFREDDKYVRIAAMEIPDCVAILVSLLRSGEPPEIQDGAAEAVAAIAGFDAYKAALVSSGAIAALVRVLEYGSQTGRERAAGGLRKLTENSDNVWSVAAHGGVTALLDICGGTGSGELIGSACRILRNLSSVAEVKRFMVERGAISIFLNLLRHRDEPLQIQAMDFLITIASEDPSVKRRSLKEGVAASLFGFSDPNSAHSAKAREIALRAIEVFCFESMEAMDDLIHIGFIDRVLFFVVNGEASTLELALKAASRLCEVSEETKKTMGEIGFIPALVSLLGGAKSFEVSKMAAEVLCGLLSLQRNRRRFMREDDNLSLILQLLGPGEEKSSATKKALLSVLSSLADSNSGRRKIAASGCLQHLERLAQSGTAAASADADAKKIVKKVSGNRFWKTINGMWSS